MVVLLEAFWAIGWTAAALIGYFVIPSSENGWRWAFALGAIPALYALIVRWGLPESARWLERRGRVAEAESVVQCVRVRSARADGPGRSRADLERDSRPGARRRRRPRRATGFARCGGGSSACARPCLWLVWFCVNFSYYGAFIWIPTILVAQGYDLVRSFGFTLIITLAQLPGYAAAAWLIEVWGRRATLSIFLAGSAVVGDPLRHGLRRAGRHRDGHGAVVLQPRSMGRLYAVTPEMYPTSLRATGSGWAAGAGRIASIVAPLTVPLMLALGGTPALFGLFAVFFAVAATAAWGLVDRRGRALDDR